MLIGGLNFDIALVVGPGQMALVRANISAIKAEGLSKLNNLTVIAHPAAFDRR